MSLFDDLESELPDTPDSDLPDSDPLDAWLDGELDEERQERLARRLAGDADLRREMQERLVLRRRVGELPRGVPPGRDLWPEIAARLEPEASTVRRGPWSRRRSARPRGPSPALWRQALAATLGVAAGALLAFAALTGVESGDGGGVGGGDGVAGGPGESGAPVLAARDTRGPQDTADPAGDVRPASLDEVSARLEADFLRARESLWVELLARRDELPPETWGVVVENLNILDGVIRELRSALYQDPGNRRLERMLLSNHQRQLDLLHRLTREV